jgi:hypothetical protein
MTKSRGILRKKMTLTPSYLVRRHRLTYESWRGVIDRPRSDRRYKGLEVCERWYKFENFLEDMGERPSKDFSISRKDHSKGYYPDNCFWETIADNSRECARRNAAFMNTEENNEEKRLRMTGAKIWICDQCGKRRYRVPCKGCSGVKKKRKR